jgi:hypothetical protein
MLWQRYVFRRGPDVHEMWDLLFEKRPVRLLYIAGRGFDTRAQSVMAEFVQNLRVSGASIEVADLLLLGFSGYQLSDELREQTTQNAAALEGLFGTIGTSQTLKIGSSAGGEDDISASNALRIGTEQVLEHVANHTDIVLDVSSMPRVAYLALLTGLLHRLIPDKSASGCLAAGGINLQVLVAEDANLDAQIRSEDPSNDLILIPGFSSALHAESVQDWPFVWFPILGENRLGQLEKVLISSIPEVAEICPILPHPSRDPRRGDRLLVEYKRPLFDSRQTPIGNILYAHESNPFEAYRQLLGAMERYRDSMKILGGCRLVVTPLGSKLITLGAGLACFEMRPTDAEQNYGVAIPYAGPTRYVAASSAFQEATPEIASLLLTGSAYQ